MKRITMMLAAGAIFIFSAHGQGFQNLNFESAQNLPANPPEFVSLVATANALPNWTAYGGVSVLPEINYVSNSFASDTPVELEGGSLALSGNWSVGLYDYGSISQTGMVPAHAESLQFEARGPGSGGSFGASGFSVTLGGVTLGGADQGQLNIPFSVLSEGPDYTAYGVNIPADLDGQMETLTFGCQGGGGVLLDNIEFSTSAIPEPSEYALIGLGVVLISYSHRRMRRL